MSAHEAAGNGRGGSRRVLVTGAAGFLGSHLCEHLVADGHDVVGVDCFTDFYARPLKERNLSGLLEGERFVFHEVDLSVDPLEGLLDGIHDVFHLAAQAGVRGSFGETFGVYLRHNVRAMQRLLEAASAREVKRFIYASSSSVYGNAGAGHPTDEATPREPVSPYGMTKCATEDLAGVYARTRGVPAIGLRYFTAYGPRQRPDMAFNRFLQRALADEPINILGDGHQSRDFTYVGDIVSGTVAALDGRPGTIYNLGGGNPVELLDVVTLVEQLLERRVRVEHRPAVMGEARVTASDCALARAELGYEPATTLADGLAAQLEWFQSVTGSAGPVRLNGRARGRRTAAER